MFKNITRTTPASYLARSESFYTICSWKPHSNSKIFTMNYAGGDDSGKRQQQQQQQQQHGGEVGNSFEEEDEEERQNTGPAGQLFPSSSSSPSSHHHKNHQHQQTSFYPQAPYHHQPPTPRGGWMHGGGESSSRVADPMMVDYSPAPVTPASYNNSNNNNQQGMMMVVEREHMFDKVVTPSDVGKLNRLVIPKQHAERYFPLDSSTNDKGLLLNFEDRNGKPWRFRYSYWNSSQSYVMTKGWSRFVKDKKLDAGDIVSFQRGVGGSAKDRLFIDWRHRPDAPAPPYQLSSSNLSFPLSHHQFSLNTSNIHPWNPLFLQSQPAPSRNHSNLMLQPSSYRYGNTGGPYHTIGTGSVVNVNQSGSGSVIYFRSGGGTDMIPLHQRNMGGIMDIPPVAAPPAPPSEVVFDSVPVVHGKAAAKRLRLFGVNMDCPISDNDDQDYDPASEMVSSTTATNPVSMGNYHHDHHHPPTSSSTIPYLQLRLYEEEEETQFHQTAMTPSSSSEAFNKTTKSPSSRMSFDLDI